MNETFRMLNACACGRQYDVSHRVPGDLILCECGVRFSATFHVSHSPKVLRCSGCGANLQSDARFCSYCSAEVTLEERKLSSVCPKCYARAARDANYCMECGLRIEPQALAALPADTRCPRCKAGMRQRMLGSAAVGECSGCGGLWLTEGHFDRVCEQADEQEQASRGLTHGINPVRAVPDQLRYLPCVECGEMMNRRNYAMSSGIIIDVCAKHGVWLDHSELERILAFVREGGLDRARYKQIQRLKDQERRTRMADTFSSGSMLPDDLRSRRGRAGVYDLFEWVAVLVDLITPNR